MKTKIKCVVKELAWHIGMLIAAAVFILVVRAVDRSFPVIKSFQVTSQKVTPDSVVIEGRLEKIRDCSLVEINAYTPDGASLDINFLKRPITGKAGTRPVGIQLWGPWEVFNDNNSTVGIFITHACSIFWTQTTRLTSLTIVKVEPSEVFNPLSNLNPTQETK